MTPSIRENASLRALNTFGVEARARRLIEVEDAAALPEALALARAHGPLLVLGGGSNVLFTSDFDGTVLHLRTRGCRVLDDDATGALVEAEAGESWDGLVRWTLERGLYGLENLALIPGSVGASPVQNIGAYGVEMRERFAGLDAIAVADGQGRTFGHDDCAFGYRDSLFKRAEAGRWLIVRVRFRLSRSPDVRTAYGEVLEALRAAGHGDAPSPAEVAEAIRGIRRRKLPDPAVLGNAGSFFKNPVVDADAARTLVAGNPGMPHWAAEGGVKLSAAWMIERCGWKGARDGDAGVHAAHALVLVNHGRATGAQILALSERIRESVLARFGVALEPEPLIV